MENQDLREEYCKNCASGNLEDNVCFCYQYFRIIGKIEKRTDLPCHGFSNTLKDEEKKNYKVTKSGWFQDLATED